MADKNKHPDNDASLESSGLTLRLQAEALSRRSISLSQQKLGPLSPKETQKLVIALQEHQVELAMQNEELRLLQTALDAAYLRYFDLFDFAPVGYCTVSEQGLILQTNFVAANLLGLLGGEMIKEPISHFILAEDQDIHYLHRKQLMATGESQSYEPRMVKKRRHVILGTFREHCREGRQWNARTPLRAERYLQTETDR